MPVSGVGQLGTGEEAACGDQGVHQVAPPGGHGGDQILPSTLAAHRQDGVELAVRARARAAEGLGRGDKGLALEGAFDDLDEVIGGMGKVAEGLMGDGLSLGDGSSEQRGEVGLALVDPLGRRPLAGTVSRGQAAIFEETAVLSRGLPSF